MYPSNKNSRGFTLIEILVAVAVLTIGLMATAALVTRTLQDTTRSREATLAAILATEKMEDLNRWPATDPHVVAPPAGTAGSLVADVTANVVVGGVATPINYFDDVAQGQAAGSWAVTVSGVDPVTGAPVFTTTEHRPNGSIVTTNAAPAGSSFRRRWLIEGDQPVAGVRRITVFVTNQDPINPVTFRMSTVRP